MTCSIEISGRKKPDPWSKVRYIEGCDISAQQLLNLPSSLTDGLEDAGEKVSCDFHCRFIVHLYSVAIQPADVYREKP